MSRDPDDVSGQVARNSVRGAPRTQEMPEPVNQLTAVSEASEPLYHMTPSFMPASSTSMGVAAPTTYSCSGKVTGWLDVFSQRRVTFTR